MKQEIQKADKYMDDDYLNELLKSNRTIRFLRAIKGIKSKELADACGLPTRKILEIERSKETPSLETQSLIANGLSMSLKDLQSACGWASKSMEREK